MSLIRDSYLRVPKSGIHDLALEKIRRDLWIENLDFAKKKSLGLRTTKQDSPGVDLLHSDSSHYLIPRGYVLPLGVDAVESPFPPVAAGAVFPPFRLRLREHQKRAAADLEASEEDGILCLGCGKGKTILALWYAGEIGQKTLILVDRDFLADQWIRRIKQSYWITRKRVGLIQGRKKRVGDLFTVAMVHTLAKRDYPPEWYDQFGLVIADECHVMAAPTFAPLIPRFRCQRLGLSATPKRRDGMDAVFRLHLGDRYIHTDLSRNRSATWAFYRLPALLSPRVEAGCYQRLPIKKRDGSPVFALQRTRYDTLVGTSGAWNSVIVTQIEQAVRSGRYVLLLGTRTDQLRQIEESLFERKVDVGYVDSTIKGQARNDAFGKQVILATTSLASRALDIPRLDTLVLLYPSNDEGFIRQAVGRLDRPEGKEPIVVVFAHNTVDSLARKEKEMRDVIHEIDEGAKLLTTGIRRD